MAVVRKTLEEVLLWLAAREGIAHRDDLLKAGFPIALVRRCVREGHATWIRRVWVATPTVADDLRDAALAGGRISCTSLARRRKWWMPEGTSSALHLHLVPGSGSPRLDEKWAGTTHWTKPLGPVKRSLLATTEDALQHIAVCMPHDNALVLWESAARVEKIAPETLRAISWRSVAARGLAEEVTGLSDSGLETLVAAPLRAYGLEVRQQIVLAGKPVDLLVERRLVVQLDGFAHHSSAAQRTKDIAHDTELRLRGYTVLRFGYAQVVHDWPSVERAIRRAVATGLAA